MSKESSTEIFYFIVGNTSQKANKQENQFTQVKQALIITQDKFLKKALYSSASIATRYKSNYSVTETVVAPSTLHANFMRFNAPLYNKVTFR